MTYNVVLCPGERSKLARVLTRHHLKTHSSHEMAGGGWMPFCSVETGGLLGVNGSTLQGLVLGLPPPGVWKL